MRFKFLKNLDYQLEAIDAVVRVFDTGANIARSEAVFAMQHPNASQVIANELDLGEQQILQNLQAVQTQNNIDPKTVRLESMDFSVEMETGTGKTYVYLRTVLELRQKYGLLKFIILVPSVAIREGVLKTIEQTQGHLRELYGVGFNTFAYDSDKLSQVRDFVQSNDVQVMIMTIQSFNTDTKVLRQTPDRFHGERPIDLIAQTRPIVIMDEPQNMESDLAKAAIADLQPLCRLRYSATHREVYNLVYRLTPVDAYRKNLVKKISVYGVTENDPNALVLRVRGVVADKKGLSAQVEIEIKNADGTYRLGEVTLKPGDDFQQKSKGNEKYVGMVVTDINARKNRIEVGSSFYYVEAESEHKEAIFRTQIQQTIKAHFDKQVEVGSRLKVLSLFFIDKVDNYMLEESLLRVMFEEEYKKLQVNYPPFQNLDAHVVHKGYFASKKNKGSLEYRDSVSGSSKEDKEAYNLIMREKEKLLSFEEPVSFIFSHSALKEGWDNPNIFQICTLRETKSLMKKRQEIGRGLRLPVDVAGERVYDPDVAVLTVIANASYEEYAGGLQQEFIEAGYTGGLDASNAREQKITVRTTKYLHSEDFLELWRRISRRTKFSLEVLAEQLVAQSVEKIGELHIHAITVVVEKGQIYFGADGAAEQIRETTAIGYGIERSVYIPNVLDRIARETGVTKSTILSILSKSQNGELLFRNPEEYVRSVVLIIKNELQNLLVNEGLAYIPTEDAWELQLLFSDFEALPSGLIASPEKSVFDYVVYDSRGEREFAEKLEHDGRVKVFTKLPRGFVVNTPLGDYTPDWAIVLKEREGEKLYLVRETKFGYADLVKELTWDELKKIECAKKHFKAIGSELQVVQKTDLSDLI